MSSEVQEPLIRYPQLEGIFVNDQRVESKKEVEVLIRSLIRLEEALLAT